MMLEIQKKLQDKFFTACESANMLAVKQLLETPALKKHIDVGAQDFKVLRKPLQHQDEELVAYFLGHAQEKDKDNIAKIITEEFAHACRRGNLQEINFYYNHPQLSGYLEYHMDKSALISDEFIQACAVGDLHTIDFYYSQPKIKKHLQCHLDKSACFKAAYNGGNLDVLRFVILHFSITREDHHVVNTMRYGNNPVLFEKTIGLFNKQKLPSLLEQRLAVKEEVPLRPKTKI